MKMMHPATDVEFDSSDPDLFEDMNHMSAEGRRVYTKELIKLFEERLNK